MNDPDLKRPSTTEAAPAAPGWAESEFDDILAGLPVTPEIAGARAAYLDCLAGVGGRADIEGAHDRCRAHLLSALADQVSESERHRLDAALSAMEAEIATRT